MDRWTTANRWRKGQLDHRRGQQVDEHLEKEKMEKHTLSWEENKLGRKSMDYSDYWARVWEGSIL